ncbi:MAG TPA: chloride channel protein, partial [Polyangiaceae bacterium]
MANRKPSEAAPRFVRGVLALVRRLHRSSSPIELQLLGRTLLHSVLVGATAGLVGSCLYYALELTELWMLEGLAGYQNLRAGGEQVTHAVDRPEFRPWLLALLPALGALIAGTASALFAPETRGGGTDAIIRDFHHNRGLVRTRVPLVKAFSSIFTLGFGGSGGREGPA